MVLVGWKEGGGGWIINVDLSALKLLLIVSICHSVCIVCLTETSYCLLVCNFVKIETLWYNFRMFRSIILSEHRQPGLLLYDFLSTR